MEGRGDLDPAASARCCAAAAAAGACAPDVAGPGVAGDAGRDAAHRAAGRDAAHRDSGHYLALAPRHRPAPVGAPFTPGPLRPPGDAPQGPVGGPAAGLGERVMGLPADPRRARRARHQGGAVDGLADPQEGRDRPDAAPGRPGLGGVLAVPGAGDPGAGLLHRRPAPDSRPGAAAGPRESRAGGIAGCTASYWCPG